MPDTSSKKPAGQARKSDWNMAELDLHRFDELLRVADRLAIQVDLGDISNLHEYLAILSQLYRNFRPIITDKVTYDNKFMNMKLRIIQIKTNKKQCTYDDLNDLLELHKELLNTRQIIGLGIPSSRNMGEKDALRESVK